MIERPQRWIRVRGNFLLVETIGFGTLSTAFFIVFLWGLNDPPFWTVLVVTIWILAFMWMILGGVANDAEKP
jgi:hypothetical protein